jgi:hypothetical protein
VVAVIAALGTESGSSSRVAVVVSVSGSLPPRPFLGGSPRLPWVLGLRTHAAFAIVSIAAGVVIVVAVVAAAAGAQFPGASLIVALIYTDIPSMWVRNGLPQRRPSTGCV